MWQKLYHVSQNEFLLKNGDGELIEEEHDTHSSLDDTNTKSITVGLSALISSIVDREDEDALEDDCEGKYSKG